MKLAFMGSPEFAVPSLHALHEAGHEIAAVYTQPPKPAHRGQRETPCAVHQAALRLGMPVRTPAQLRGNEEELTHFAALNLDAAIVAAYGLILPPPILAAPKRGCLNIHASLLPRWRGAAPIQAAILAGDACSGVTIMQMESGLDTGAMLLAEATPIGPADTTAELHTRLAAIGARVILRVLNESPAPLPQAANLVTYAPKLTREDSRLDFTKPAAALERQIRAYYPRPGSLALLGDAVIKFLAAEVISAPHAAIPGEILDEHLTIACGEAALRPLRLQRAGKSAMTTADFLRGFSLAKNARFF